MELVRLADAPPAPPHRVFRRSRVRGLAAYGATVLVTLATAGLAWTTRSWLLGYVTLVLVVALLIARAPMAARLRPSNWLVRVGPAGLHVQLRSHLNTHAPSEDRTVLFLPWPEIRSTRHVRERRTLVYRDSGQRTEREVSDRRHLIELDLVADTAALAEALRAEVARKAPAVRRWYGTSATKYHHYPVRLTSETTLEIEWDVSPGARAFLEEVGRFTRVDAPVTRDDDDSPLAALARPEQERRLLTLAETGQEIAAVSLARDLYGLDLAGARALLDRLRVKGGGVARR